MSVVTLLDHVIEISKLKNDAALARLLEVGAPVISKLRAGKLNLGPFMILAIHETTGLRVADIRTISGVRGARQGAQ